MKWIESLGGPLILLGNDDLHQWGGVSRSSKNQFESDYDYACSVDDYLGILDLGVEESKDMEILVLNDEPMMTTSIKLDENEIILARWKWGNNSSSVDNYLMEIKKLNLEFKLDKHIVFTVKSDKLLLFDATYAGWDDDIDYLEIPSVPGNYNLFSLSYQPDNETSLLLHKLKIQRNSDVIP